MNRYAASVVSALFCLVGCVLMVAMAVAPSPVSAAEVVAAAPDLSVVVSDRGFIAWLLAHVPDLVQAAGLIVTGASMLAALTPTPKDDGVLLWVRKVIDLLALNVLGAKNAKPVKDFSGYR